MFTMPLTFKTRVVLQVCAHEPVLDSVALTRGVPSDQKVHPPHSAICVRAGGGGVGATGDGVVAGVTVVVGEVAATAGSVLPETTQALRDVLPAGDVVPEGHDEQFVAPGDVE